ncbi:hypothetical protein HZ326_0574 [Fusarium oxysporum f. sp. albedinis]|nr:hypothetical protein HZ326_0574 [Fusarium oxysporum f. sp. albedinis]
MAHHRWSSIGHSKFTNPPYSLRNFGTVVCMVDVNRLGNINGYPSTQATTRKVEPYAAQSTRWVHAAGEERNSKS